MGRFSNLVEQNLNKNNKKEGKEDNKKEPLEEPLTKTPKPEAKSTESDNAAYVRGNTAIINLNVTPSLEINPPADEEQTKKEEILDAKLAQQNISSKADVIAPNTEQNEVNVSRAETKDNQNVFSRGWEILSTIENNIEPDELNAGQEEQLEETLKVEMAQEKPSTSDVNYNPLNFDEATNNVPTQAQPSVLQNASTSTLLSSETQSKLEKEQSSQKDEKKEEKFEAEDKTKNEKKTEEPKNQQTKVKSPKQMPTTAKKPEEFNPIVGAVIVAAFMTVLAYFGYALFNSINTKPKSSPAITKSIVQPSRAKEEIKGGVTSAPVKQTSETNQQKQEASDSTTEVTGSDQGIKGYEERYIEKKRPYTPENFLNELRQKFGD